MIKNLGRRALGPLLGTKRLQGVFQAMVEVGLAGLNIGEGNVPAASGERWVAEYVRTNCLTSGDEAFLFDVGANVGDYTRMLLEIFGRSARVWAFEPAPGAFAILESSLGQDPNVRLHRVALSDKEGHAVLYSPAPTSKLGSLHEIEERLGRRGSSVALEYEIALTTIDRFCEVEDIRRIDFLKLDVEGHELNVLRGAERMLESNAIRAIQFEFGLANLDSRTYFRDFFGLLGDRYRLFRILKNGLHPILAYNETSEVFKRATNYLALRRM